VRLAEAHVLPGLAGVAAAVDAIARHDVAADAVSPMPMKTRSGLVSLTATAPTDAL
jgi:hypothetical protein